jgi:hypothetical protein
MPRRDAVFATRQAISPLLAISNLLKNTQIDNDYTAMSSFVIQWDSRRKNSWKLAFPELTEYFKIDQ